MQLFKPVISKGLRKKIIGNIIRAMHKDFDLQLTCKQLYVNMNKILQFLMMIAPPDNQVQFFSVKKKMNNSPYLIELDRLQYCLNFISIPISFHSLLFLAHQTYCVQNDPELGVILCYSNFFALIKLTIQQMKQQSQDDDEEIDKQIFRKTKFFYKLKRLGYLNDENITEFYDSYADLVKTVGSDLNAKNYSFYGIRFGYADAEYVADNDLLKEKKILGSQNKFPLYLEVLYEHKTQKQIIQLTRINLYLQGEQPQTYRHDFIGQILYTKATR